jgi:hypothetical protein
VRGWPEVSFWPDHVKQIKKWIAEEERRQNKEWANTVEGAAVRQADASEQSLKYARQSVLVASISVGVSVTALIVATVALFKS